MSHFPTFEEFFRALWKHSPYPWQSALADQVAGGIWPSWVTLPTGAGKTACLDIAIYALARQAVLSPAARSAPVRIIFAVNRRIVVDEAFERARAIGLRLKAAAGSPEDALFPVARALLQLAGEDALVGDAVPLEAYPLRGGTFTNNSWARSPFQPIILTTTLDQLGSRLLFRGYGVSEQAQPLHAALLANDALLILDEAHTSKAFSQTLAAIAKFRASRNLPGLPFAAVQLTATPPADAHAAFGLTPADEDESICPDLVRRLKAAKPTALLEVPGAKGKQRHSKMAKTAAAQAADYYKAGHRRILIVVNRVATAEETKIELKKLFAPTGKSGAESPVTVDLLTGRLRPLDRQELIASLTSVHQLDRAQPDADVPPLVLVATQCVEVGADYDFDALITELAPLDSLRQRFGRLNRSGRAIPAPATVLLPEESLDEAKPDPLYGMALYHTSQWLEKQGSTLDFGIRAIQTTLPQGDALTCCLAPAPQAPVLLPSHLDLLCQTSPRPHVEPEVSCYIHGFTQPQASVSVLFRSDLAFPRNLQEALGEDTGAKLHAAAPLGTEMAEVPIYHLKNWLAGKIEPDSGGDGAEVPAVVSYSGTGEVAISPLPLRWRQQEASILSNVNDLRPGDVVIFSTTVAASGLIPLGNDKPTDQFEEAHLLARDRICLRLDSAAMRGLLASALPPLTVEAHPEDLEAGDDMAALKRLLAKDPALLFKHHASLKLPPALVAALAMLAALKKPGRWILDSYGAGESMGVLLRCTARVGYTKWPLEPEELGEQSDRGGALVPLADHNQAVSDRAEGYATLLGPALQQVFRDAGLWHDWGKADPRFQAMLHAVPLYALGAKALIAKSRGYLSQVERNAIAVQAELPKGFRHELISVILLMTGGPVMDHPEQDLLLHLVASHHGYCRPLAPPVMDKAPEPIELSINGELIEYYGSSYPLADISSGVADRFWKLTRRFGWWGLPYLELLLRLADQRESARLAANLPTSAPS